jgi:hypothetical protein
MFMEIVCEPPVRVPSWICQALVPVELTVTGVPPIVAEMAERGTVVVGAGEREKFTTAAVL